MRGLAVYVSSPFPHMFSLCPLCVSAAMDVMDILAPLCVLSVSVWDLCGDGVCTEMDGERNTDDL